MQSLSGCRHRSGADVEPALQFSAVHGSKRARVCTAWYNVPTSTVRIVMRVVQNGLNGHWIVYNAYPVQ